MIYVLDAFGKIGLFAFFIALVVGLIFFFRFLIEKNGKKILEESRPSDVLTKKYYSVDLDKYSGLLRNVGMAISLAMVLAAFEFPAFDEKSLMDLGSLDVEMEELMEIPPTEQKPPPPPKIQQPEIVEVPDEEEIEDEIEIELDVEIDEETVVEEVIVSDAPAEEEVVDEIFEIVEEGAEPPGGMNEFLKWVVKSMSYPSQAKRMGVEGRVFLQFVVDKDGSLSDVKVVRGIGAGCDEEALRVIKTAAKWKPGKQRGRPVRQRMVLPIVFKLN